MNIFSPTREKRFLFFLAVDILITILSLAAAFFIRFEFSFPPDFERRFLFWLPVVILVKIAMMLAFRLYAITWTFVGIKELISSFQATFVASVGIFLVNSVVRLTMEGYALPRSVILLDFILTFLLVAGFRVSKRLYLEVIKEQKLGTRTLIVGAGPTGERLVREFIRSADNDYYPAALVDDDKAKVGTRIHGVLVAGTLDEIEKVVEKYKPRVAIIAITTAKHIKIQEIFEKLLAAGIKDIKVVPHITQLPNRSLSVKDIQDIRIEDLLYRDPVTIDESSVRKFIESKVVMVTGGAGSIGSEIVRQAFRYHPKKVIIFEIDETEVFNLMLKLKSETDLATQVVPFIGDVRRADSLEKAFTTYKPDVVFHAAAYKHVPMMEMFPGEALGTNILGTYTLASKAIEHGVKVFVNISTDKAVNPTSIMGASKRMAEIICTTLNRKNGTRFVSLRFGNVLGSRGSVIPIFLDQIKQGGPVTVTHRDVERYFMTIPEAVTLVFQAASMGKGGEVFVLDMGKPIRILKMAEDLIKLNGMEPYDDIKITFVGLRPGEKMFEELLTAEEGTDSTEHKKIFVAKNISRLDFKELEGVMGDIDQIRHKNLSEIKEYLKTIVPFYGEQ